MQCEICGKELENPRKAKIEGSILTVCGECVKLGTEVFFAGAKQAVKEPYMRKITPAYQQEVEDEEMLSEEYPKLIRQAREKRGMNRKEFAMMLNERESVVDKLESGKFRPDDKLVRKLQKKLGIQLLE
jgi:putative transcription factor